MPLSDSSVLSEKEQSLLDELTGVCNANNIKVCLNAPNWFYEGAMVALDVEHDEAGGFVGCGICVSGYNTVYYFSDLPLLTGINFDSLAIIAHNGKTDIECLQQWGCNVKQEQLVWDTELIAHIIDSSRKGYGLKKLAESDLCIVYPSYDDIVGKKSAKIRRTLEKWPVSIVSLYNALDVYCTMKLYEQQVKSSGGSRASDTSTAQYFNTLEKPVSLIFQGMETRGIRVDLDYLKQLKMDLERQKTPIENEIKNDLGNINLNSPKQLIGALHAKEIYPELKGRPSTDKRALATFKDRPVVDSLLKYSELDTLLASFVAPYLERNTEVVHPFFNQCGTRTGRPSCSNPNLLQIPKRTENGKLVRKMFIPRTGMRLGDSDLSGIEPRMLAHLSQDKNMLKLFNDGVDFHSYFAQRVGVERDVAKVFDLETYYRATKYGVARTLKCTQDKAQKYIDMAWNLFPELRRWEEKIIFDAKRSGFITTLLGRRIKIDNLDSANNWKREAAERQVMNNIAQGSAAEVMKLGMLKVFNDKRMHPQFGLLIQVYDQLVAESPDMENDLKYMKEDMEKAIELSIPLICEAKSGENWADVK